MDERKVPSSPNDDRREPVESHPVPATPAPAHTPLLRRGRVLVVDDEVLLGSAIRRILQREHDVTVLSDAHEARARLANGDSFDVILCDLMMPDMTGMELHGELRQVAPDQAQRMVFLTGGAFTAEAQAFLDEVPNARLQKPLDIARLRELVRERVALGPGAGGETDRDDGA